MTERIQLAVLTLAAVAVVLGLGVLVGVFPPGGSSNDPTLSAREESPSTSVRVLVSGTLLRLDTGVLVINDGASEQRIATDDTTLVIRGAGHMLVSDHDLSRLQPGDTLVIDANAGTDGLSIAHLITANGYVNRPGIVVAQGAGYIEMRLAAGKYAQDFDDTPARVILAPNARCEWLDPYGVWIPARCPDYPVGSVVALQGFLADDGARVATFLWAYWQSP